MPYVIVMVIIALLGVVVLAVLVKGLGKTMGRLRGKGR